MFIEKRTIGRKIFPNVTSGKYEIAYRKDEGAWVNINELSIIVPPGITAQLEISLDSNEIHGE